MVKFSTLIYTEKYLENNEIIEINLVICKCYTKFWFYLSETIIINRFEI